MRGTGEEDEIIPYPPFLLSHTLPARTTQWHRTYIHKPAPPTPSMSSDDPTSSIPPPFQLAKWIPFTARAGAITHKDSSVRTRHLHSCAWFVVIRRSTPILMQSSNRSRTASWKPREDKSVRGRKREATRPESLRDRFYVTTNIEVSFSTGNNTCVGTYLTRHPQWLKACGTLCVGLNAPILAPIHAAAS